MSPYCEIDSPSAAAGVVRVPSCMKTITHWIDGKLVRAGGGAQRRCVQSRDRRGAGQGRVRDAGVVDEAVESAARASQTWRSVSIAKRTKILFAFRQLVDKHQHEIAQAAHARARQGHRRRARRSQPRPRGDRVRVRHRRPREGRVLRERLDRGRLVLDPPAARRRRRHHAVQLPGDGADVDVPDRDRVREHVRAQAERARSVGRRCSARSCSPTRACRRACSTSCTATRSRSIACSSIPKIARGVVRRLDADRAVHLRDRHAARQARAGARRREEPHDRAARRRHGARGRRGGLAPATARRASAAWRSRCSSRSATRPTSSSR